jgi:hypothetical protein
MTSKITLRTIKARLAAAYPDIAFTYGTGGRGHNRGHSVSWVGGPAELDVRQGAGCLGGDGHWRCYDPVKHFTRHMTDAETAAWWVQFELERAERAAAEPARRAQAKADGIAKRAATLAHKKARADLLRNAFPGIEFDLSGDRVAWIDGPDVAAIVALLSVSQWACIRSESAAGKAAATRSKRLARRLTASKARSVTIARAIVRRAVAYRQAARRDYLRDAQMALPFLLAA